jgi:hypothetical protein
MYSLGTLFVSGIYVQIPCIKEIMMMIIIQTEILNYNCPNNSPDYPAIRIAEGQSFKMDVTG